MRAFDRHSGTIGCETPISQSYRNTQNVRRVFKAEWGDHFKLGLAGSWDHAPVAIGFDLGASLMVVPQGVV
jgi:Domain of unknown function (DUF6434)